MARGHFISFLNELKRRNVFRVAVVYLAVLPLDNLSQDDANEPFALGIHDDLLTLTCSCPSTRRRSIAEWSVSDRLMRLPAPSSSTPTCLM